jgi:hypothetical protein
MELPVLLCLKIQKVNFLIGPYLSLPMGNLKMSFESISGSEKISSGAIFGMLFGLEGSKTMDKFDLVFGGRYIFDFSPICCLEESSAYSTKQTSEPVFTRRGLLLNFGLKFKTN